MSRQPPSSAPTTERAGENISPASADRVTSRGERLIFVGGAPRAGTTLVQNMLDCHPLVLGGPEFHHLPDIFELRRDLLASLERGWIRQFCTRERIDQLIAGLIQDFLLPLADRHGARFVCDHTPANVLVFRHMLEVLPGARCVHVVRDPRAVTASMLKVGRRAGQQEWDSPAYTRSVAAAIATIRSSLEAGFRAAREHPDRVIHVRYGSLVQDPELETRRICAFLGLDWSETMLRPADAPHLSEDPIVNEVWYTEAEFWRNPDPAGREVWKGSLKPRHEAWVTAAFRHDARLERLGFRLRYESGRAKWFGRLLETTAYLIPRSAPMLVTRAAGAFKRRIGDVGSLVADFRQTRRAGGRAT